MSSSPEDWGPSLRAYTIVLIVVSTLAVALRFWSRAVVPTAKASRFWWDDWTILVAWVWRISIIWPYWMLTPIRSSSSLIVVVLFI